jgi:hypothetical protein
MSTDQRGNRASTLHLSESMWGAPALAARCEPSAPDTSRNDSKRRLRSDVCHRCHRPVPWQRRHLELNRCCPNPHSFIAAPPRCIPSSLEAGPTPALGPLSCLALPWRTDRYRTTLNFSSRSTRAKRATAMLRTPVARRSGWLDGWSTIHRTHNLVLCIEVAIHRYELRP